MSNECVGWAYRQDVAPAGRKFVLVTLGNWGSGIGCCWGAQTKLAMCTGQTDRAVRDHMAALESDGLIRRVVRRDKRGRRDYDAYILDPDGRFGLDDVLPVERTEARVEMEVLRGAPEAGFAAGDSDPPPADSAAGDGDSPPEESSGGDDASTGRFFRYHRKILPVPPEDSSGISNEDTKEIPKRYKTRARDPSPLGGEGTRTLEPGEAAAAGAGEKPAAADRRPWRTLSAQALSRAVAVRRAERGSTVRLGGITETERQAAEAYLQAVERGEIEDTGGRAAAHACDGWRANVPRLRDVIGDKDYRTWVACLTPIEDDGETLEMACPTQMIGDFVRQHFGEQIEGIIGRRLSMRVTLWAGPAAAKRVRAGGWCGEAEAGGQIETGGVNVGEDRGTG